MELEYIKSSKQQFGYYKTLGEQNFAQLDENELFWQYNEESNSKEFNNEKFSRG